MVPISDKFPCNTLYHCSFHRTLQYIYILDLSGAEILHLIREIKKEKESGKEYKNRNVWFFLN